MKTMISMLLLIFFLISPTVFTANPAPVCPYLYYDNAGVCSLCSSDSSPTCGTGFCSMYYPAISGGITTCTLDPICSAGNFFNGFATVEADKICTPCSSTKATQSICSSSLCPGFVWKSSVTPISCVAMATCALYFFPNSAGVCTACQSADATICGIKNYCQNYFFNEVSSTCVSCYLDLNTDRRNPSLTPNQCSCRYEYYWSTVTKKCQKCSDATTALLCKLCPTYVFYSPKSTCTKCDSIPFYNGVDEPVNKECGCDIGYFWNKDTNLCVSCSTANQASCGLASCNGFYFDLKNLGSTDGTCSSCSTISYTKSINPITNLKKCTCIDDYVWVASDLTLAQPIATSSCKPCKQANQTECDGNQCKNWLWIQQLSCTNLCSGTDVDTTAQPYVINHYCTCSKGKGWNVKTKTCQSCALSKDASICNQKSCSDYFYYLGVCTSCGLVASQNADSKIVAALEDLAINRVCNCSSGFAWNSDKYICQSCLIAALDNCGVKSCLSFFVSNGSCLICPAGSIARVNNFDRTVCQCPKNFVWSPVTSKCIACDEATSVLDLSTNTCVDCRTLFNSNKNVLNRYTCQCDPTYVFIYNVCTCPDLSYDNGTNCITNCNLLPRSSGNNTMRPGQCLCSTNFTWNTTTKNCRCSNPSLYANGTSCLPCSKWNTDATTHPNKPDTCICKPPLFWSPLYKQCVCSGNKINSPFYYNNITNTCSKCSQTATNSTGLGFANYCYCYPSMIWNATLRKCIPDTKSVMATPLFAIDCSTIPYGTQAKINDTHCGCKATYTWNVNYKACICLTSCTCNISMGITVSPTICVACQSIPGATSVNTAKACNCDKFFVWNPVTLRCDCPAPYVMNNRGTKCFNCSISNNATGVNKNGFSCDCANNYVWSAAEGTCLIDTSIIIRPMFSGNLLDTRLNCLNVQYSSGFPLNNFLCGCLYNMIFNDYTGKCMPCVTYFNPYYCGCRSGSTDFWNIFQQACSSGSGCTSSAPLTCPAAMCSETSNKLITKIAGQTQLVLAGDNKAIFMTSDFQYGKQNVQCPCPPGSAWSSARKRCYSISINGAY